MNEEPLFAERLGSSRDVAIFLATLTDQQLTTVLALLPVDLAKQLSWEITNLGQVTGSERRRVLRRFAHCAKLAPRKLDARRSSAPRKLLQRLQTPDDLLQLPDSDVKRLLQSIDTTLWAPVLSRVPGVVHRKVLANMARRPADLLREEIDALPPISDVEYNRVQANFVAAANQVLDDAGTRLPSAA